VQGGAVLVPNGTSRDHGTWQGMKQPLEKHIVAEIKRIQGEVDHQKRFIKAHVDQALVVETAEQEMKALHTRLAVLEANLVKVTADANLSD
jgi:hypothetical protein